MIYIVVEKGLKVKYVKLHKTLYRLLCIELLFYLKLATDLKNIDIIINPYDLCVTNKLVKG